jgi:hypothetical protein
MRKKQRKEGKVMQLIINRKFAATCVFAVWMLSVGFMYVLGIDMDVLTYVLIMTALVTTLLGDERFVLTKDIKQ